MTETIRLGARDFELRPLTLGQLRRLLDALDAMAGKSGGALIDAAAAVVTAGLAPAHPPLTAAMVLGCEAARPRHRSSRNAGCSDRSVRHRHPPRPQPIADTPRRQTCTGLRDLSPV